MSVKLNQHSFFKYMLTNYKETKVPTVSCSIDRELHFLLFPFENSIALQVVKYLSWNHGLINVLVFTVTDGDWFKEVVRTDLIYKEWFSF